jgi:hypothetical protein
MKCSKITAATVCGMFAWERKAPLGIQRKQFYSGASLLPPPMPLVEIFNLLSSGSVRAQYTSNSRPDINWLPGAPTVAGNPTALYCKWQLTHGHVPVSTRTFFITNKRPVLYECCST